MRVWENKECSEGGVKKCNAILYSRVFCKVC